MMVTMIIVTCVEELSKDYFKVCILRPYCSLWHLKFGHMIIYDSHRTSREIISCLLQILRMMQKLNS